MATPTLTRRDRQGTSKGASAPETDPFAHYSLFLPDPDAIERLGIAPVDQVFENIKDGEIENSNPDQLNIMDPKPLISESGAINATDLVQVFLTIFYSHSSKDGTIFSIRVLWNRDHPDSQETVGLSSMIFPRQWTSYPLNHPNPFLVWEQTWCLINDPRMSLHPRRPDREAEVPDERIEVIQPTNGGPSSTWRPLYATPVTCWKEGDWQRSPSRQPPRINSNPDTIMQEQKLFCQS